MQGEFHPLTLHSLPRTTDLVRPEARPEPRFTFESPALSVMTDLRQVSPVCIQADSGLATAHQLMVSSGVRMLFVEDHEHSLVGLVTVADLLGHKPLQVTHDHGKSHAEMTVQDIMTHRLTLEALLLEDVGKARVGELVATMKQLGQQHALVVDINPANGHHEVCGLFSTTQMARLLGMSLSFIRLPQALYEIQRTVLHADEVLT